MTLGLSEIIPLISQAIDLYNQQGQALAGASVKAKELQAARRKQLLEELSNLNAIEKKAKERFQVEIDGIDFSIKKAQASGQEHAHLERKKLEITIARIKEEIIFEQKKAKIVSELEKQSFAGTEHFIVNKDKFLDKQNKKREDKQKELADSLRQTEEALVIFEITEQKKSSDAYAKSQEEKTAKLKEENEKRLQEEKTHQDKLRQAEKDSNKQKEQVILDFKKTEMKIDDEFEMITDNKQKTRDDEALANQKDLNALRIQAISDTLNILSNLNELFAGKSKAQQERAFKVQKAINIANAVIDTYKGATSVLASGIPPPFNFIAMASVITAGLLNVKKIAQTEFGGGAPASSSGGGGGIGSAPSLPQVDTSAVAFQFPSVGGGGSQAQQSRVYVVESDIRATTGRVEVAEANATFG
jgi:hypothetical protein